MKRSLIVVAAFVVPLAIFLIAELPGLQMSERQAEERTHSLEVRLAQATAVQRKLPQFQAEREKMVREEEELQLFLPSGPATETLRSVVEGAAESAHLRLTHFHSSVRWTPSGDPYQEVLVNIELIGSAADFAPFFRALDAEKRFISIPRVALQPQDKLWRSEFAMMSYAMPNSGE